MDKLSHEAREELRRALNKEIGLERTSKLGDDDLDDIGFFLLTTMAIGIKMKLREEGQGRSQKK
ncbi:MAG: hypothetical protein A3H76_00550 [Candidatus Lloydbacteria bacterium RIFCSPLOWO2_02_FULL_54_12]|nr:MAG: hypothetical protein A3H76_00550 [Candidatus Lloydbacteria bacterium RIFCSPLOWO2_02_FULL_54_12]